MKSAKHGSSAILLFGCMVLNMRAFKDRTVVPISALCTEFHFPIRRDRTFPSGLCEKQRPFPVDVSPDPMRRTPSKLEWFHTFRQESFGHMKYKLSKVSFYALELYSL